MSSYAVTNSGHQHLTTPPGVVVTPPRFQSLLFTFYHSVREQRDLGGWKLSRLSEKEPKGPRRRKERMCICCTGWGWKTLPLTLRKDPGRFRRPVPTVPGHSSG